MDGYMKEVLRVAVAQICQTIGYNATQTAPLELLQDVLDKFLKEFTRDLRRQVEHYNRTEANLDDVTLTLNSINVNVSELLDYINNVEPVPFAMEMPKFPARKNSCLNFLKPGSKEVLTRPVHVHDHLPPMLPAEISQPSDTAPQPSTSSNSNGGPSGVDIKPNPDNLNVGDQNNANENNVSPGLANPVQNFNKSTLQSLFKSNSNFEDSDRPSTREVSSVVMTTGGYISPAVEGKMPEAIVPDIIDKLMGLDEPPPPTPPPPPRVPTPAPVASRPASRSANSTPIPLTDPVKSEDREKEKMLPSASKESKKSLEFNANHPRKTDPNDLMVMGGKKDRVINPMTMPPNLSPAKAVKMSKKKQQMAMAMAHNPALHHLNPNNYANMLLKKAKKQKPGLMQTHPQAQMDKHGTEKNSKLDPAEKTQRKYIKMLQKMAKQGKIPVELLNNIMITDKKTKILNPHILPMLPPGPERMQLEKLLKKHVKQRQKQMKQQMMQEAQKLKKSSMSQQPPPLVPLFAPQPTAAAAAGKELGTAALNLMEGEQKHKISAEPKNEPTNLSPTKQPFLMTPTTAGVTSGGAQLQHLSPVPPPTKLPDGSVPKTSKSPLIPVESTATVDLDQVGDSLAPPQLTLDGKELKLSNEPDRSKLNIFKKISKQKTPKSSSPTPLRLPSGMTDSPIINLPAGTAITPALGPSSSNVGRNLFPPLPNEATDIINLDDDPLPLNVQAKSLQAPAGATDLTTPMQRVFGEKPLGTTTTQPPPQLPTGTTSAAPVPGEDLANKPKKRGRKPGSKNSPKIPGQLPASLLKKSKKMKMDPKLFNPQMPLPPDLANALAVGAGNLPYDSMAAQLFANTAMNPMEWAQNKQLQQQMMIMAAAKERKEQRKKNKMLKQDLMATAMPSSASTSGSGGAVPTSEEIQNINKKLMRMDTVLKPAPMPTGQPTNDLSVETSLITGKKLPSPSLFPNASAAPNTNTSPLKSPGAAAAASKRLMQGMEAMAAAAAAGMGQPFMLPNRPAFPNLPTNMLSMLPFPFTARPGLIPSGIFPTPGLGTFPNNPKNPLLPGMFPFPNLKQSSTSTASTSSAAGDTGSQGSEDLSMSKKKSSERSYCNVAPLVPAFLIKDSPESSKTSTSEQTHGHGGHDNELPKTPKPRNSSSISSAAAGHEHLLKKATDPHTPDSMTSGVGSAKSIPNTPGGGMSLSSFEQLMKKNESPIDMVTMNKGNKSRLSNSVVPPMQDACLDFSMNKKHTPPGLGGTKKQPPITLNNEPIEVSDDSDETSQPPPTVPAPQHPVSVPKPNLQHQPMPVSSTPTSAPTHFSMDEMFVPNTASSKLPSFSRIGAGTVLHHPDSDLSTKELKKLKKQVKKTSLSITNSLINPEPKTEGVSKLAGGADLIPLSSTGMAYSSKNIPFTSLTANANPTFNTTHNKPGDFNATTTDSAPTQQPSTSSSSLYENVTITAAIPSSATSNPTSQSPPSSSANLFDIHKKRKEHKKIKKELKEGKIKKKKDKKDKSKSKEKAEKYLQTSPSKERLESVMGVGGSSVTGGGSGGNPIKEKDLLKKLKKEKKKEKIRNSTALDDPPPAMAASQTPATVLGDNERKPKTSTSSSSSVNPTAINDVESPAPTVASATTPVSSAIPKLTLKLGNTQSPTPLDDMHKNPNSSTATASATASAPVAPKSPPREPAREPSPELARISPLVTRPPKHKVNPDPTVSSNSAGNTSALDSFGDLNKSNTSSNVSMIVPPPSPWLSGGTISASSVLLPHQLLQTAKHDMAGASSNQTIDSSKSTAAAHASTSSAGDRQSPLTLITETSRPSSYIDAEGNRVWICPACGKVDDGSPMIGCDGCDAWYHWVCVGIIVAPKDNEDWFCRVCITRKKGLHGSDKKRKRNKKK